MNWLLFSFGAKVNQEEINTIAVQYGTCLISGNVLYCAALCVLFHGLTAGYWMFHIHQKFG